ncbi:hypothetical protein V6N12_030664 [Hibiscus sabdariffa]|uniref:Uncharacterized protein n=1 Tax=Hibiscus sabdariffa TaxID=183260 RepID=A0ABR1ZYP9_9ROSI
MQMRGGDDDTLLPLSNFIAKHLWKSRTVLLDQIDCYSGNGYLILVIPFNIFANGIADVQTSGVLSVNSRSYGKKGPTTFVLTHKGKDSKTYLIKYLIKTKKFCGHSSKWILSVESVLSKSLKIGAGVRNFKCGREMVVGDIIGIGIAIANVLCLIAFRIINHPPCWWTIHQRRILATWTLSSPTYSYSSSLSITQKFSS